MARRPTQDRGITEQISSQRAYRDELSSQVAVRNAAKARDVEDKRWAAEEMQMYQEVLKQEEELKRVQTQVAKREMANAYASQISLARQGKEDKFEPGFRDRTEAVDRWIAESKDEVAQRAIEKEQRDNLARRNRQASINEALRQQVEEKKQRELAAKILERQQADAYLRKVDEANQREAYQANEKQQQKKQFAYELDMQRGVQQKEPTPSRPIVDAFTSGHHLNKENASAGRRTEAKPAYRSSPFATDDTVETVVRKPQSRSSAPYAVYEESAPATRVSAAPRSVAPFALYDDLEPLARGHPTDIPGVPRHLTAHQRSQYDTTNPAKRGRY
mmetsp:Transcript_7848/g.15069  ORF Transcript_7848/g.15069 Transcript_7848/m.15069 type:complete len:332 (+) Transcript_7848:1514-2509(+)